MPPTTSITERRIAVPRIQEESGIPQHRKQITEIALLLILPAGALLFMTRRFGAEDRLPFVPFLAAASTILMVCCRHGRF